MIFVQDGYIFPAQTPQLFVIILFKAVKVFPGFVMIAGFN